MVEQLVRRVIQQAVASRTRCCKREQPWNDEMLDRPNEIEISDGRKLLQAELLQAFVLY